MTSNLSIHKLLDKRDVHNALIAIHQRLEESTQIRGELIERIKRMSTLYSDMLRYLPSPQLDPELQQHWTYLLRNLYEIVDELPQDPSINRHHAEMYNYYTLMLSDGLASVIGLLNEYPNMYVEDRMRYDELVDRIVMGILHTTLWTDECGELLQHCDAYVLEAAIGAVFLSLCRQWHLGKLKWLLSELDLFDKDGPFNALRARVVMAIFHLSIRYESRLELYEDQLGYRTLFRSTLLSEEIKTLWQALLMTHSTPRISQYVEHVAQDFTSSSALEQLQSTLMQRIEETNKPSFVTDPIDRQQAMEELLPLADDMQEFKREIDELRKDGYDVHYGMFGSMIEDDFFRLDAHWVLPFDLHHHQVRERLHLSDSIALTILKNSLPEWAYLDQYGLILKIKKTPHPILQALTAEFRAQENMINKMHFVHPQNFNKMPLPEYLQCLVQYSYQFYRQIQRGGLSLIETSSFQEQPPLTIRPLQEVMRRLQIELVHMLLKYYQYPSLEAQLEQRRYLCTLLRDPDELALAQATLAQVLFDHKQYVPALMELERIQHPDYRCQLLRAHIWVCLDEPMRAIPLLEDLVSVGEVSSEVILLLVAANLTLQNYPHALKLLLKYESVTDREVAVPMLVWCLTLLGRYDEAEFAAKEKDPTPRPLPTHSPFDTYVLMYPVRLAHLYLAQGNMDRAITLYHRVRSDFGADKLTFWCQEDRAALRQIGIPSYLIDIICNDARSK